jgi:threonine dehydratase
VATHSSGIHALSLAWAAGRCGVPCNVVMPHTAPQAHKDAVRRCGGTITECEPSTSSREAVCDILRAPREGQNPHVPRIAARECFAHGLSSVSQASRSP